MLKPKVSKWWKESHEIYLSEIVCTDKFDIFLNELREGKLFKIHFEKGENEYDGSKSNISFQIFQ